MQAFHTFRGSRRLCTKEFLEATVTTLSHWIKVPRFILGEFEAQSVVAKAIGTLFMCGVKYKIMVRGKLPQLDVL
jgi:hypothetical protein